MKQLECERKIKIDTYKYKIQGFRIDDKLIGHNQYINKNRSNRYSGNSEKKKIEQLISYFIIDAKLQPLTNKCDVILVFYEGDKRRDPDNIASSKKFIFDALVSSGVLHKDGQKFVGNFIDIFKPSPIKNKWYIDVYLLERLEKSGDKELPLIGKI